MLLWNSLNRKTPLMTTKSIVPAHRKPVVCVGRGEAGYGTLVRYDAVPRVSRSGAKTMSLRESFSLLISIKAP